MKKIFKGIGYSVMVIVVLIVLFFTGIYFFNRYALTQEAKTLVSYGEQITVDKHKMTVATKGDATKQPIVLLPGFGTGSPVLDFNELATDLSKQYYVVTIEPFGYGLSDVVSTKRDLETISNELHTAIQELNLKNYILMGHSIAGLYTLDYLNRYPDEVNTFIGIDTSVPFQGDTQTDMSASLDLLSSSGVYRALSSVNPDLLNYPKGTKEEKEEFRKLSLKNMGNTTILNEAKAMPQNFKDSEKLRYPKNDSVLFILASESIEDTTNGDWLKLHENMVSDLKKSEIVVLDGPHYLHHTQASTIAKLTTEFLETN